MDIVTNIKGPVQSTTCISIDDADVPMPLSEVLDDGVDVPMLIKEEPDNYAAVPEPITHIPDDSDDATMFIKEEPDNDIDVPVQTKKEPTDGNTVPVPLRLEPDDVADFLAPRKLEHDDCANSAVPIKKEPNNCANAAMTIKKEPDDYVNLSVQTKKASDNVDYVTEPIKKEPDNFILENVLCFNLSDAKLSNQQQSADQNYCELMGCKNNIPIIEIAPILIDSLSHPKEVKQTIKSEHEDACKSSGTSTQTAVQALLVPITTPNLYEVKDEFPCTTHTEAVYNNRLDIGSELVEVKGELDCKPEIVGNVNNVVILGDVNIQRSVEHKDTVNQLSGTSMECGIVKKEDNAFGK